MTRREILTTALNKTGIPWRFGGSPCHFNILPLSNIHGWTSGQNNTLREVTLRAGFSIINECVKMSGRYFQTLTPTWGFRATRIN